MSNETLWTQYTQAYPHIPKNGTMTELSFAKTFLSTLDSRPLKLQPDHVSNPKTLEITSSYVLPRMPNQYKKPTGDSNVDAEAQRTSEFNVTLRSSRNPVLSLSLLGMDGGTSMLALKEKVARELHVEGTDKIRVLYKKKPAGDVKTVKELVGGDDVGKEVEFSIMVMGYKEAEDITMMDSDASVAQGPNSNGALFGEDFWTELRAFLVEKIQDEIKATEMFDAFKETWGRRSQG